MWALVTRVDGIEVVVRSGGCRCLGDHVLLQLRTTIVAWASGDTWRDSQFVSGRSTEQYYSYLVVLYIAEVVNCFIDCDIYM